VSLARRVGQDILIVAEVFTRFGPGTRHRPIMIKTLRIGDVLLSGGVCVRRATGQGGVPGDSHG
jgi:hypothetical protein